ncbi:MAG TPA: zf-HC2 domain-containing protein, partial [Thermoanaerobaculia bacterium]|nr:zf-HC2 domain-containing protein [Thermoanaerobaculia bacterium]
MDHQRIEEESIAELYATGRLSPVDEELFEEHLLECRECRERVAWADGLRDAVRTVAAEEV